MWRVNRRLVVMGFAMVAALVSAATVISPRVFAAEKETVLA